jgi:antirestriction protein ArdC
VFNAEQCDGLPAHYTATAEPLALTPMQRLEAADRFFAATDADKDGNLRYASDAPIPGPEGACSGPPQTMTRFR